MKIKTVCKIDRIYKNGLAPIFLRFTDRRQCKYQSLGISIDPKHWDVAKSKITSDCPDCVEFQHKINSMLSQYTKKIAKLEALDIPLTFENLLESATKRVTYTIEGYFAKQIEHLKMVDQHATAMKYQFTLSSLRKFGKTDISFQSINYAYLKDFELFLRKSGNVDNSIATKFSVLKAVYNKAVADALFTPQDNLFAKFKVGRLWCATRKRAITKEEIHKLIALELPDSKSPYLGFARDIFLFSYFMAGINFKDIATLRFCDINNDRIYYARQKTSKEMNCYLNEYSEALIAKYRGDKSEDDYIFPVLSRGVHLTAKQKLDRIHKVLCKVNKHLGELGVMVGVKINLTTYVARHSFASVLKRSGVNIAIISESLGHSDLATTQIYLDSFENSQIDEAMKHLL